MDVQRHAERWGGQDIAKPSSDARFELGVRPLALPVTSCAIAVGAGVYLVSLGTHGLFFMTSMISSATLIATGPALRQCHPIRILVSHTVATVTGLLVHCWALPQPVGIAISVAIALSIILLLDCLHPPALANAAIVQIAPYGWDEIAVATAISCLALSAFSYLVLLSLRIWYADRRRC